MSARAADARDYPRSIALVQGRQVRLAPLISDVMPLAELDRALASMAGGGGDRLKIIVESR